MLRVLLLYVYLKILHSAYIIIQIIQYQYCFRIPTAGLLVAKY